LNSWTNTAKYTDLHTEPNQWSPIWIDSLRPVRVLYHNHDLQTSEAPLENKLNEGHQLINEC